MSSTFVVFTRAFAPYRFQFYEKLRNLGFPEMQLILVEAVPQDHPWSRGMSEIYHGEVRVTGTGMNGFRRAWRELTECSPSFLMVTEYTPYAALAMIWAKWHGVPFVLATDAGRNSPAYSLRWYSLPWHQIWRRMAVGILACTAEAERTARELNKPTLLAPHAVDVSEYLPVERAGRTGALIYLYVGALIERKGVRELIAAGQILAARKGPEFTIRMVGTGLLRGEMEEAARIHPWLDLRGFSEGEALIREYQEADIFVLPTHEDTYAVVVHEAACCGLPLVVSEAAGACEVLVGDFGSGAAIPPRDPQILADAMQRMREEPEYRLSCGRRAREIAENYSVDGLVQKCANWLRELIENRDCR